MFCLQNKKIEFDFQEFDLTKLNLSSIKVIMQRNLFQKCKHFMYCSVLSLGGKVNTRRMSQPDMESIFTKIIMKYSCHRKLLCELSKFSKLNGFILLGY